MAAPVLAISTDSWHYRYYSWIRSFWMFNTEKTVTSLCPYCQTMIWFTVAAVTLSPFIVTFYIAFKILDWIAFGIDKCLGVGVYDEYYLTTDGSAFPPPKTKAGKIVFNVLSAIDDAMDRPGGQKVQMGVAAAVVMAFVAVIGYVIAFTGYEATTKGLPAVWAYLPHLPGDAWNACLQIGYVLFRVAGLLGDMEVAAKNQLCVASMWVGHESKLAFFATCRGVSWFFTNGTLWERIGHYAIYAGEGVVASLFTGYVGYEVNTSPWMTNRRKVVAERKITRSAMRAKLAAEQQAEDERRKEEFERKAADDEEVATQKRRNRPQRKRSNFDIWFANSIQTVKTNVWQKKERAGAVTYKMVGVVPTIAAFLWAIKKRACPMVVVLTPEALQQKKNEAAAARVAEIDAARLHYEALKKQAEEQLAKVGGERDPAVLKALMEAPPVGVMTAKDAGKFFAEKAGRIRDWSLIKYDADHLVTLMMVVKDAHRKGLNPKEVTEAAKAILTLWGYYPYSVMTYSDAVNFFNLVGDGASWAHLEQSSRDRFLEDYSSKASAQGWDNDTIVKAVNAVNRRWMGLGDELSPQPTYDMDAVDAGLFFTKKVGTKRNWLTLSKDSRFQLLHASVVKARQQKLPESEITEATKAILKLWKEYPVSKMTLERATQFFSLTGYCTSWPHIKASSRDTRLKEACRLALILGWDELTVQAAGHAIRWHWDTQPNVPEVAHYESSDSTYG